MEKGTFPIDRFQQMQTPFYYYDIPLLNQTLQTLQDQLRAHPDYHLHYAVKANANPAILRHIQEAGFGADCVSGGEIQAALDAGFSPQSIVFAGVGKADWEIQLALRAQIHSFNVESIPELEVINQLAVEMQQTANVSLRINPDVGAHTHHNITTGRAENKFGIAMDRMKDTIRQALAMSNVRFVGLHFHIGSQILQMDDFVALAQRINELQDRLEQAGIRDIRHINVGGGLGIDYTDPNGHPIPTFGDYFQTYATHLRLRPGQQLHFELGRAVVGQMGTLITRCLYVKPTATRQFAIVDAGMTDLIRPALYDAYHRIENITSSEPEETYDVVGPICESSDVFVRDHRMNRTQRGDLIAIRSAGAYGEIMASRYNLRRLPGSYTSDEI